MKKKTVKKVDIKLPEDKDSVQYFHGRNNAICSTIYYDCGCSWIVVRDDIEHGHTIDTYNNYLCVEHDLTIPESKEEDE